MGSVTDRLDAAGIADVIEAAIRSGQLQPGTTVPSQNEIITEYGVAKATAAKVHALLASRGLTVPGDRGGTRVVDQIPDAPPSIEERLSALEAWRAEVERRQSGE
jgi:GntR family transcriptional regulator